MEAFSDQPSAKKIQANENGPPVFEPASLLLSTVKEKGPVLKRFDSNQLLAAAVLAAAIVLVLLLRSI